MQDTQYQPVNLSRNCVKAFILRFDILPGVIESFRSISEKLAPHFKREEKRTGTNLSFQIKNGNAQVSKNYVFDYVLVSESKGINLTFSDVQNGFWIETNRYRDNSIYKETISLLQAVFQEVKPDLTTKRIGMRYINEFKCNKPNEISHILKKRYSNVVKNLVVNEKIMRAISQEEYNFSDFKARVQYGIPNKFYPSVISTYDLILDIDMYEDSQCKIEQWSESIKKLNHAAYQIFRNAMNDKYVEELK